MAAVVVIVVAGALWYRSDTQRLHRLVDDLRDERGVVSAVVVDDEGIQEVRFTSRATVSEIDTVWERLSDVDVDRVAIGDVSVDPYEMDHGVVPAAVAAAGVHLHAAMLEVREVSDDVWLSVGFGPVPVGADEPTPRDGAVQVLMVLEELQDGELPEDLDLVVAHRARQQLDLVHVERAALERLPDTITELRRIAATDPEAGIVCDADGCHS